MTQEKSSLVIIKKSIYCYRYRKYFDYFLYRDFSKNCSPNSLVVVGTTCLVKASVDVVLCKFLS